MGQANEARDSDRSTAQLVKDLSEQTTHLMRSEARLAVREVTTKAKRGAVGGGLVAFAAVVALLGGGALVAFAVLALSEAMSAWAAALIVGVVLLVIAGLIGLVGGLLIKRSSPPVPRDAIDSVRQDVDVVKERARDESRRS